MARDLTIMFNMTFVEDFKWNKNTSANTMAISVAENEELLKN